MIYELAVYIASRLQAAEGIAVNDDEIAYIAMHVGAYLEQQSRRRDAVTCAVVCPNYYDMHILLRDRLESTLGDELDITSVITSTDADWEAIDADLVLTTIDPRGRRENAVIVQPFLTETDVEHVRQADRAHPPPAPSRPHQERAAGVLRRERCSCATSTRATRSR